MTNVSERYWDQTYSIGGWDYLNGVAAVFEVRHYIELRTVLCKHGAILDVGCGEGILVRHLDPHVRANYVGIDFSHTALEKANRLSGVTFTRSSAEQFDSPEQFHAIIFNEVLYLICEPIHHLQRYLTMLSHDGIVILSMFDHRGMPDRSRAVDELWQGIGRLPLLTLDDVRLTNITNAITWRITVARPRVKET